MKSVEAIKDRIRDLEYQYSQHFAKFRAAKTEMIRNRNSELASKCVSDILALRWVLEENYLDGSYSYDMVTNTHIHTFKEGTKVNVLTGEKL